MAISPDLVADAGLAQRLSFFSRLGSASACSGFGALRSSSASAATTGCVEVRRPDSRQFHSLGGFSRAMALEFVQAVFGAGHG